MVSKNDRKYRFEVGYGLEGTIPDAMKVPIGDKIIVPNFRNGDYGKGIYESIIVIEGLVTNNTEVLSKYGLIQTSGRNGGGKGGGDGIFLIFLVILLVVIGISAIIFFMIRDSGRETVKSPSLPYKPPPSIPSKRSSSSSSSDTEKKKRRSSYSTYSGSYGSSSHSHSHSSGSRFGGFGGGRSGGGGFGGGW